MCLTIMTTADRLGADHFFRFKENFGLSVNLGAVNVIFNVMKSSNAFFSKWHFRSSDKNVSRINRVCF